MKEARAASSPLAKRRQKPAERLLAEFGSVPDADGHQRVHLAGRALSGANISVTEMEKNALDARVFAGFHTRKSKVSKH